MTSKVVNLTYFGLKNGYFDLKSVNLTYYNLKGGQFKVILTLKVVIFDLKVIKNGFGISDLISDFGISDFKIISDFGFGISDLPKYFGFYAILSFSIHNSKSRKFFNIQICGSQQFCEIYADFLIIFLVIFALICES